MYLLEILQLSFAISYKISQVQLQANKIVTLQGTLTSW